MVTVVHTLVLTDLRAPTIAILIKVETNNSQQCNLAVAAVVAAMLAPALAALLIILLVRHTTGSIMNPMMVGKLGIWLILKMLDAGKNSGSAANSKWKPPRNKCAAVSLL